MSAAIIPPGGHVVLGSASPGVGLVGNIDIPITAADRCNYASNIVISNVDGWVALYNASGVAIDCVYWSSNASNLTSNTSDFNPPGGICLPPGSPSVTLQTPFQINSTSSGIVRYGGPNPSAGSPVLPTMNDLPEPGPPAKNTALKIAGSLTPSSICLSSSLR